MKRRDFLGLLAAGLTTPYLVTYSRLAGATPSGTPFRTGAAGIGAFDADPDYVFQHSVASGDPSPSGVVLWTRINPALAGADLYFQVARDAGFGEIVLEGMVAADQIGPARDYTVKLDLDGRLEADTRYHYRFVYAGAASRTGRCRTAPVAGARTDRLKFALLTCQDYTNGYYGALAYVAGDDSIDFVVHLGDFIYESAADPRFQSLPFPDREIVLPSGGTVALGLEDYRHIYRTYRRDANLQRAMEQHTWIITRDDHETANDCYWDYARNTLGAPDHPFTTTEGNDATLLNRLMLDSQQAWIEYVPARVSVDTSSTDPHRYLRIYRDFRFGDLVDLFMLDTRTYRTAHACGEAQLGGRYVPTCDALTSAGQTMLGRDQREWLIDGTYASGCVWKVLGNQTFMGQLGVPRLQDGALIPLNGDAWDGYVFERSLLMREFKANGVNNLVALTGDLHTYIASHLKVDYGNLNGFDAANHVGVEFMTPSVTSTNLVNLIANMYQGTPEANRLISFLTSVAVYALNPHVYYLNSVDYGYSTLEFRRGYCEWIGYSVNKNQAGGASRGIVKKFRKYTFSHRLIPWL
jgi:alkaline phosphatase D